MSLREYYVEQYASIAGGFSSEPSSAVESANHETRKALDFPANIPGIRQSDAWTLKHLHAHEMQSLVEAIDDDGSSFVTITEINKFTSRRPVEWRWVPLISKQSMQ